MGRLGTSGSHLKTVTKSARRKYQPKKSAASVEAAPFEAKKKRLTGPPSLARDTERVMVAKAAAGQVERAATKKVRGATKKAAGNTLGAVGSTAAKGLGNSAKGAGKYAVGASKYLTGGKDVVTPAAKGLLFHTGIQHEINRFKGEPSVELGGFAPGGLGLKPNRWDSPMQGPRPGERSALAAIPARGGKPRGGAADDKVTTRPIGNRTGDGPGAKGARADRAAGASGRAARLGGGGGSLGGSGGGGSLGGGGGAARGGRGGKTSKVTTKTKTKTPVDPLVQRVDDQIAAALQQDQRLIQNYQQQNTAASQQNLAGMQTLANASPYQSIQQTGAGAPTTYAGEQANTYSALVNDAGAAQAAGLSGYINQMGTQNQQLMSAMSQAVQSGGIEYARQLRAGRGDAIGKLREQDLAQQVEAGKLQLLQDRFNLDVGRAQVDADYKSGQLQNGRMAIEARDRASQRSYQAQLARANVSLSKNQAGAVAKMTTERRQQVAAMNKFITSGKDPVTGAETSWKAKDILYPGGGKEVGPLDFDDLVNALMDETGADADIAANFAISRFGSYYTPARKLGYQVQIKNVGGRPRAVLVRKRRKIRKGGTEDFYRDSVN